MNKSITNIKYNHLNQATEVDFGIKKTKYIYTATGVKLQTQIFEGTQLKTKTDYSGAYVYVNNVLSFTNIQGGRIVSSQTEGTSNNDVFQYNLTDHLGNVRVTFEKGADGKAEIIQEDHYYPFGMRMSGQHYDNKILINKYLYNGKEQQEQTGMYDYGFRQLDPQLGRWHVVDAMAERFMSESPYAYVNNNPISQYDILGLISSSNLTNIGFSADVWAMIQWAWDVTPEESSFGSYSGAQAMQGASLDGGFGKMSKAKYGKFWGTSFGKFLQRLGGWETDFSGIGKNGEKYQWYTKDNPYGLPEKSQSDMFGTYGLDWGYESNSNVLEKYAPKGGINADGQIRYYYCGSCMHDPGNGIAKYDRYMYQKPVILRTNFEMYHRNNQPNQYLDGAFYHVQQAFYKEHNLTRKTFFDLLGTDINSPTLTINYNPAEISFTPQFQKEYKLYIQSIIPNMDVQFIEKNTLNPTCKKRHKKK